MFFNKASLVSLTELAVLLAIGLVLVSNPVVAEDCKKIPGKTCACKTSRTTIDFSNYAGEKYAHPMFPKVNSTKDGSYAYDPCVPIATLPGCDNAAVCETTSSRTNQSLGDLTSAKYKGDPLEKTLSVVYTDKASSRTAEVELRCGPLKLLLRSKDGLKYIFTMNSPNLCVTSGLSPGSILLIIFFVLVLIYIIGGMLYLRFAHGARGKEQIPNYDFWEDFPLLVRDGVVFVSKGCKPDPTYQQI